MAGGVAGKGHALVTAARARCAAVLEALDKAQANGQVAGGTANAVEVALTVDPLVTQAITALQSIT